MRNGYNGWGGKKKIKPNNRVTEKTPRASSALLSYQIQGICDRSYNKYKALDGSPMLSISSKEN